MIWYGLCFFSFFLDVFLFSPYNNNDKIAAACFTASLLHFPSLSR